MDGKTNRENPSNQSKSKKFAQVVTRMNHRIRYSFFPNGYFLFSDQIDRRDRLKIGKNYNLLQLNIYVLSLEMPSIIKFSESLLPCSVEKRPMRLRFILQAPPNLHPFVLEGLVCTKTFFTLLLGVAYSVSKSESSSSSEVRNYDHHRWETNKLMRKTNTPCVPFDVFLFYHLRKLAVDHVRRRGLKECVTNRFCPRPYFAGLFRALQAPCGVASNSYERHASTPQI